MGSLMNKLGLVYISLLYAILFYCSLPILYLNFEFQLMIVKLTKLHYCILKIITIFCANRLNYFSCQKLNQSIISFSRWTNFGTSFETRNRERSTNRTKHIYWRAAAADHYCAFVFHEDTVPHDANWRIRWWWKCSWWNRRWW